MTPVADQIPSLRAGSALAFARRAGDSPVAAALVVYGAALAWTLLVRLPLRRMDGLDDAFYVEVAHLWSRGVLPYVGAFDVKPPGFFALVAAAQTLLGPSLDSLRAVAVAFDAVAATALYFLGRRIGAPAVGLFAAILYPILSELVTSNDAYCPLAALTILAFLAALSPLSPMKRAALTGLLIGAAGTVKQTAGFEAVALLFILLSARDGAGRRAGAALAFTIAAAVAPLGFLLYFAGHGAAQALSTTRCWAPCSRPASASEGVSLLGGVGRYFLVQKSIVAIFGLACLALLRRRALAKALARRSARRPRSLVRVGDPVDPRAARDRDHLSRPDARAGLASGWAVPDPGDARAQAHPLGDAPRRARPGDDRDGARRSRQ